MATALGRERDGLLFRPQGHGRRLPSGVLTGFERVDLAFPRSCAGPVIYDRSCVAARSLTDEVPNALKALPWLYQASITHDALATMPASAAESARLLRLWGLPYVRLVLTDVVRHVDAHRLNSRQLKHRAEIPAARTTSKFKAPKTREHSSSEPSQHR